LPGRRLCVLLALLVPTGALRAGAEGLVASILVDQDAVVRVTDAGLRKAGFVADRDQLSRLRLRCQGQEVPLLIESPAATGEEQFAISFLGHQRRGSGTYWNAYGATNVYWLDLAPSPVGRQRLRLEPSPKGPSAWPRQDDSPQVLHLEEDLRLIDFTGGDRPSEKWYWEEIRATDRAPVKVGVRLAGLVSTQPFTLRVHFMGYTSLPEQPDHQVEVSWNGRAIGRAIWDGRSPFTFAATLDGTQSREGDNELGFDARGDTRGRIDLVLLDWVEVAFTRENLLSPTGQVEVSASASAVTRVRETGNKPVYLWDTEASLVWEARRIAGDAEFRLAPDAKPMARLLATRRGTGAAPLGIVVRRPVDLAAGGADFIIVCPVALAPAANRLAAARRSQGLLTRTVLIDDVYDGFSQGQLDPAALRAFILHARRYWTPRPSYLLLMGDASWDYRGLLRAAAGVEGALETRRGQALAEGAGRLQVPTLRLETAWGSGASDGLLAQAEGEPGLSELAVGRLPVGTLAEAEAVVDKTLAAGAGLRTPGEALVFADHVAEHRDACARFAASAAALGFHVEALCDGPGSEVGAPAWQRVLSALDRGLDLLLFVGHGSRDVIQTGPVPDTSRDQDVLTWRHLDALQESSVRPVVLTLSWDVAPFDHPWADSIGEKLLRLPSRGAVAVIAASRRTPPAYALAEGFLAALACAPSPRLGDLFLAALRNVPDAEVRNSYNLLGDPTLPIKQGAPSACRRETEGPLVLPGSPERPLSGGCGH
jgi:hypothetical protein